MRALLANTNLQILFAVTLMVVMGVSSIIPVLPTLIKVFGVTPENIGLVLTAFTLPGVLFTPIFGILADRLGRKKILVPALVLFGVAGFACTLARNWELLLLLRFLQGTGAAAFGMINITIIGDIFSGSERTAALGLNASVLSIGTAVYPAIGGGLAILGWHYPFALPLVAVALAGLVLWCLDTPEPETTQSLGAYFRHAATQLRKRQAIGLFLCTLGTFILLYGPFVTFFPLLLDSRFQATAPQIGMLISVASLITALAASQLGRLVHYFSEIRLLRAAFLGYALTFAIIPEFTSFAWLLAPTLAFGAAQALSIPNIMSLLNDLATPQTRAAFMAANGTILRLGQTLAPLCMGSIYAFSGLRAVFWSGSVIALVLFSLTYVFLRPRDSA